MYAIWDKEENDWVRELPSKVDDGGTAVLAFFSLKAAQDRAAKHWGFNRFCDLLESGCGYVREVY